MTETDSENKEEKTESDNVIFIGSKPFMNYVASVNFQFSVKNKKEVVIKARGKFITKSVDIAEVVQKRFLKEQNIYVKNIKIDSEEFKNKLGRVVNISTIEIALSKK